MRVKDITATLEAVAPLHLQESYDNAGLIVGSPEQEVSGVLFCLDSLEITVHEAVQKGCNLIVAHHPIVFRGLKRLNGSTYVERTIMEAVRQGVAIYAMHTNLDNVLRQGVNAKLAERLGIGECQILAARTGSTDTGAGLIGTLPQAISEIAFLQHLKEQLRTGCIRHTALLGKPVQRIALCGGAGSFLLPQAIAAGADVFVSADFKYHEFFDAEGRILIADVGHYESEFFTIELLRDIVQEKFPTFALHLTELRTNPVFYY
ncbi:MAG: Nif3-like dinuclear metal center hexameric protein [Saprospiraceae bacterium]|nr:Nif3-like dinuclear metal center hexameric protein [Saprospiraceae bacterium]MDW8482916.1 Nif3-like dinuclear metal center hexameric protein [Saprospiraceae bacterium]